MAANRTIVLSNKSLGDDDYDDDMRAVYETRDDDRRETSTGAGAGSGGEYGFNVPVVKNKGGASLLCIYI